RAVGAAPQPFGGELAEPALDQVEPRAVGGGEMQAEAGVADEPAVHSGGLVGRGVVHYDVHVQVLGDGAVDEVQEADELGRPVPVGEIGDHVARRDVERGVQVGGAVAAVVVGSSLGHAGQQRQDRGGAIQRLDLGLL